MKYPNNIKKIKNGKKNSIFSFKNKGDTLEYDLNLANHYYNQHAIANIHKKPTPIKVVEIDKNNKIITKAFFQTPSTTDYNGIYKSKYIDFEAKETMSNTSFALKNIHNHQIKHLVNIKDHGGIAFLIIQFVNLDKTFLLKIEDFIEFKNNNKRKSIPLSFFNSNSYIIEYNFHPRIDYLKTVSKVYFEGSKYEKKKGKEEK
ncbi:MAG: Holliday junction resolvase RecU [Bacilli bacterium]